MTHWQFWLQGDEAWLCANPRHADCIHYDCAPSFAAAALFLALGVALFSGTELFSTLLLIDGGLTLIFLIKMEVSLCLRPDSKRFFRALADQLLALLLTVKTVPCAAAHLEPPAAAAFFCFFLFGFPRLALGLSVFLALLLGFLMKL